MVGGVRVVSHDRDEIIIGEFRVLELALLVDAVASHCIGNVLGWSVAPDSTYLTSDMVSNFPHDHSYGLISCRKSADNKVVREWEVMVEYELDDKNPERIFSVRYKTTRTGFAEEKRGFRVSGVRIISEVSSRQMLDVLNYFRERFQALGSETGFFSSWSNAGLAVIVRCANCSHHVLIPSKKILSVFKSYSQPSDANEKLKCSKCGERGKARIWPVIPGEVYQSYPRIPDPNASSIFGKW